MLRTSRLIQPVRDCHAQATAPRTGQQIVSRNAMIKAGTARRRAGSAVSSRRYAGLAIDWGKATSVAPKAMTHRSSG